jgi:hypothetical protein
MNEEEKKAAEAKALADKATADALAATVDPTEADKLAEKDREIAKLKEERDNYKVVALKRKGKLPNDTEFFNDEGGEPELSVAEQVKLALLERDIDIRERAKEEEVKRLAKENSELKLALKNRPETSMDGGDGGGSGVEVKDNVFSVSQLAELEKRAKRLNLDPVKYIDNAKNNLQKQAQR